MSDLRPDLIKRARQMAINNSQNTHIWANMTDEEMLRSLDFLRTDLKTGQEGLTLAAILLFGKDTTILSALPQHRRDAIYRVKNLDRYDDRDDIRTNLNELLNDPLDDLLDDTQNKILNLIKDNNSLTYDEISNQLNISSSTVKRKIKEMKELDIIIRVNGKRDGYWKILK